MYATYHVLLICENQDDSIEHKWIFDDGLKRETSQEEKLQKKLCRIRQTDSYGTWNSAFAFPILSLSKESTT